MNDHSTKTTIDAFDDLLDGDTPTPGALRKVAESAQADREAARDSVRRAAAHVRQRGAHAARTAHEKAHAIGASVRRRAPSVAARVRQELAVPIRWRVIGPILGGSAVVAGAVLAALLAWDGHRYSMPEEPKAMVVKAVPGAPAPSGAATEVAAPTATPSTAAIPTQSASASPSAPATSHGDVEPETSLPALPPAPTEATVQNCTAAVPLLNGLFASTGQARTPEQIAWAGFGYRCAQSGALTYSNAGYAARSSQKARDEPRPTEGKAGSAESERTPARTPKPPGRAATSQARAVASVPQGATPALAAAPASAPGTCVLRGTASTTEGAAMPGAPIEISGLDGSRFRQKINADAEGRFSVSVPSGARVRVMLRARGYRDDVRETLGCAAIALTGTKSNPLSSIFDAARRADRSIKGATGGR